MRQLLILNGASSAGKTTLAKALQDRLPGTYLYCSLDMFWNMTPRSVPASSENFPHLKQAMARSVKALVDTGHNVIVDIIFRDGDDARRFIDELAALSPVLIKVDCPLEVLNGREAARGDRRIGLARSQLGTVHQDIAYDMVVETASASAEDCAQQVRAVLEGA